MLLKAGEQLMIVCHVRLTRKASTRTSCSERPTRTASKSSGLEKTLSTTASSIDPVEMRVSL